MQDNYLEAIWRHSQECREDLDALADIAKQQHFSRLEQRAAERALQILIEACISVAKFWLKSQCNTPPVDAYESFSKLASYQHISPKELQQWRKIIGMRNALVYDYLNLDTELIHQVIIRQDYLALIDFIKQAKSTIK